MPITFPFFLFAKPAEHALRWIRIDASSSLPDPNQTGSSLADPSLAEAQRRLAARLPPHLRRDLFRDE